MRGLAQHGDPEAVALAYAWGLLRQAGLAPETARCARCGADGPLVAFDVAAGGAVCTDCTDGAGRGGGLRLDADAMRTLQTLAQPSLRRALATLASPDARSIQWRVLDRHLAFHVGSLRSARHLPELRSTAPDA